MMRDNNVNEQKVEECSKPEDALNQKCSDEELIEVTSLKRKREIKSSLPEVLNWLRHVAKYSCNPSIESIPAHSKLWSQSLLIKEALLIRRHSKNTNASEHLQMDQNKKTRMHPTMYENESLDHQWVEKLRCSKRVTSSTKSSLCPCCNSHAAPDSKLIISQHEGEKNTFNKPRNNKFLSSSNKKSTKADPFEKQVSIGPSFQANVPEWTGAVLESDSKWLGTTLWPPEDADHVKLINKSDYFIDSFTCKCLCPNSVECVRFHVAENRFKLRRELGLIFHHWQFNRMGEEVSLSWTKEEEMIFKNMMRKHSAFPNRFWRKASKFLRTKTREKLVSYYFNVFLIRKRSYQNRVSPNVVDSDDDEKECGCIGDRFGYKALYVPGSRVFTCTLNKELPIELE